MNNEIKQYLDPGKKNLILIYALYLGGVILPLLPLIGGVFAFANQSYDDKLYKSHYVFAFRTFCIGLAASFLAMIATFLFIISILYMPVFVWFVVRSIIALQYLLEGKAHPNPLTLWIK